MRPSCAARGRRTSRDRRAPPNACGRCASRCGRISSTPSKRARQPRGRVERSRLERERVRVERRERRAQPTWSRRARGRASRTARPSSATRPSCVAKPSCVVRRGFDLRTCASERGRCGRVECRCVERDRVRAKHVVCENTRPTGRTRVPRLPHRHSFPSWSEQLQRDRAERGCVEYDCERVQRRARESTQGAQA